MRQPNPAMNFPALGEGRCQGWLAFCSGEHPAGDANRGEKMPVSLVFWPKAGGLSFQQLPNKGYQCHYFWCHLEISCSDFADAAATKGAAIPAGGNRRGWVGAIVPKPLSHAWGGCGEGR